MFTYRTAEECRGIAARTSENLNLYKNVWHAAEIACVLGNNSAEAAERALRILGGKLESTHSFTLPDGSERKIAVIRKTKPTPPNYPRPAAKMKKQPW